MAIANLTKSTVGVTNISSLSSTPNATEGLTAAQLQALFDKTGADTKTYINSTLTSEIDSAVDTLEAADTSLGTRATNLESGWTAVGDTWTYASATTINVPSGAASKYQKGDKIKLTQTTVKYFYIITVADTLLTVTGGSDYTVANAVISAISYSHQENPLGFPQWFNFTGTTTGITETSGTKVAKFNIKYPIININFSFTFGSSSAFSTPVGLYLPVNVNQATLPCCSLLNTGDTLFFGQAGGGIDNLIYFKVNNVGGSYSAAVNVSSTVPFTWGTTDVLSFQGSFPIA